MEIKWEGVDWMNLAHDRDQRRDFVNRVMNLQVPYKAGDFLTTWVTISFPRRILLHGVSAFFVIRGCIQKFPDWVNNEINNKNKPSLTNNTKGYSGKNSYIDSQKSDKTAPSGRELYHLQFSLQAASPETFGYTLVCRRKKSNEDWGGPTRTNSLCSDVAG
jgi:hypothetical protein